MPSAVKGVHLLKQTLETLPISKAFLVPAKNHLLNLFSKELYENLSPSFKEVFFETGVVLHYPGETIEQVYFPLNCLVSVTIAMNNGATAETALLGKHEVVGINAVLSRRPATTQTTYMIQQEGSALKIDAKVLRQEFNQSQELRDVLLDYTQALIAQVSQTAACNSLHPLEQRFARWLLEVQVRSESNDLKITQEFIAHMLGVRRAGVTQAAQKFKERGLIRYGRGHIQIIDQQGLESSACECFSCLRKEYNRLLGGT
jgi:CRP-like cAMP-binding protein